MGKRCINRRLLSALSAAVLILWSAPSAFAKELVVGGQAVGIQVETRGALVAGLTQVETAEGIKKPAQEAGLREGDVICALNGETVFSASELIERIASSDGEAAELSVRRNGESVRIAVTPVKSKDGKWMLGMWLRDGISGIGTVTFTDPGSGIYGALGHSISETDGGGDIPVDKGVITDAEIVGVNPAAAGRPGELNGCSDSGRILGSIDSNTAHGIFGKAAGPLGDRRLDTGTVTTGKASILCTLQGRRCEEYSVEINRIYKDSSGEHVMLTVTDPELLERTGGIVQGMSGSPIIQNGMIVGAVTHVFVNDPTRGYGVSIQDMLRSAGVAA